MDPRWSSTSHLLEGLLSSDESEPWREFDRRYRSILISVLRRLGVTAEDAADLAQETFLDFVRSHREGTYDRTKGRLSSWLIAVARHRFVDFRRKRAAYHGARGDSVLEQLVLDDVSEDLWEQERKKKIAEDALDSLRKNSDFSDSTIQAFDLCAVRGQSPQEVATELGMSVHAVYQAKQRCLARIRAFMEKVAPCYE